MIEVEEKKLTMRFYPRRRFTGISEGAKQSLEECAREEANRCGREIISIEIIEENQDFPNEPESVRLIATTKPRR